MFKFSRASGKDIVKEIKKLSTKSTALKIKQENTDIFGSYLCKLFNNCINKGIFPDVLKHANSTSVFRKSYRGSKENYHPVSTFSLSL